MGKICHNCHYENKDTASFCSSCGKPFEENVLYQSTTKIKEIHSWYKRALFFLVGIVIIVGTIFVIMQNWIGLFITLLFGIPLIIKLSSSVLLNKATEITLEKNNNRYNDYKKSKE